MSGVVTLSQLNYRRDELAPRLPLRNRMHKLGFD